MLNSSTSALIAEKLGGLVSKKIVLTDKKGQYLASTYPCSKSKTYDVRKDSRIVPLFYGGETIGYAYIDEPVEAVKPAANIVKSMIELLVHQVSLSDAIVSRDQRQDKFVYDLLNDESLDPDYVLAEAKVFNLDLKSPKVVLVLIVNGQEGENLSAEEATLDDKEITISRAKRGITRALESFYTRLSKNVIAYFGKNTFVILKDLGDEGELANNLDHFRTTLKTIHGIIQSELRTDITLGVGSYHPGISGLRDSYKEAFLACQLGEELWGTNQVFNIDDFGVVAPLLSGLNEKNLEFSENMFKKLSDEEEVVKTIGVFFESNMSLTKTSKILKIHRNTLVYRLDKITEILGLDPRNFEDAVQIKLALLFNQFAKNNEVVVK